jgi:chaperone LolA
MMIRFIIFLTFISSAFSSESAEKILKNIVKKYKECHNFTAEFIHTEYFKLTGSKNEINGKIYVKDGIKYRLVTDDQTVVTDGKVVWTYSPFNNQVLIDYVKEGDGSLLPRDLLFKYPKEYYATLLKELSIDEDNYYLLKLDPKENIHGYIQSMQILVNRKTYIISKVEYTDYENNVSSFEINKIDTTTPLFDSQFIYQIKEGVKVVDLRM